MAEVQPNDLQLRLAKLKHDGEERAAERLAKKLGLPYADLGKMPVSLEAVRMIPEAKARDAKVAGVELKSKAIAVAAANPELSATKMLLEELKKEGYEIKVFVVSLASLAVAWRFYKFVRAETKEIVGKVEIEKSRIEDLKSKLTSFEVVKKEFAALDFATVSPATLIEVMLGGAFALHASDIHTEAEEKGARIRFRVDGVLHDAYDGLPLHAYGALISRIKLLAELKLNIRDEAQDGRFTIEVGSTDVEVRVSVIPAEFGETIVMRILDPSATMVDFHELGFREDHLALVKRELAKPNGLILNTGPTGSGKTTTLYAFLRTINNSGIKIITLEDPIEYRLEGIEQTQVDEESGYTFVNGLRAIVRQDPDVILVGEVRDLETADIALQAALTGHLVLSTLHTNDAVGAVPRLVNLGVKPVSIGPALTLAIAQRLVRILCPDCKKPVAADDALKTKIKKFLDRLPAKVDKKKYENYAIYTPAGCTKCGNIGYKGRKGIFEFLEGGPDLERTILREASEVALRELAEKQEMVTMQQDGILKVLEGITSFAEVESVTGEIAWPSK